MEVPSLRQDGVDLGRVQGLTQEAGHGQGFEALQIARVHRGGEHHDDNGPAKIFLFRKGFQRQPDGRRNVAAGF